MTQPHPISIRLSSEQTALLDAIAQQQDRSRSYLVKHAVDDFLQRYEDWVNGIQLAINEADAGMGIPAEEVFAELLEKYKV